MKDPLPDAAGALTPQRSRRIPDGAVLLLIVACSSSLLIFVIYLQAEF